MIPAFVLPFADFKSIKVPQSEEPVVSNLGSELIGTLLVVLLVLIALLLAGRWRSAGPSSKATPPAWRKPDKPAADDEVWVLIDGSNVMHWQDNTPRIEPVRQVVDHLKRLGYVPGVVFDANAGWKLFDRYQHDQDFARLLGIEARQVLVVAKGTPADPFLLETAREFGARIVTNDRYRDWAADFPEVTAPDFLIRGSLTGAEVRLRGLQPAAEAAVQA